MANNYGKNYDISYEPSDKRKFYRLTNPVKVTINGQKYKTINWSVSAFKIMNCSKNFSEGQNTVAEIEINFQGFVVKFDQKIRILRIEPEANTLIAEYIDISPRNKEILSYFSEGLITGEFQPFDEVIKHIDIPVTEEYLNKTFRENEDGQKQSFFRTLGVYIYVLAGIAVLLYAFYLYYSHVYMMQIDSAIISGKTEVINSPSKGILSEIYVKEGEYADKGKPLFKIFDSKIQREIENKKNEILKNTALLNEKQKKLTNLKSRLENYKKDFSLKLKVQEEIIESVGEKIDLLNMELTKKSLLYERKLISGPEIDELKRKILSLNQDLTLANYEYYQIYQSIKDPENGTALGIRGNDDSKSLKAEIDTLKDIINIDQKELSYVKSLDGQNTVKAPFKAFLQEIPAFQGKYVDEKTPIVLLKDVSGEKFVEAYLTEAEALKLKLGLKVRIAIPSYNIKLEGKLINLEKRQEFLGKDLIIAVIQPDKPELLRDIKDSTPAKVTFIINKLFKTRYLPDV